MSDNIRIIAPFSSLSLFIKISLSELSKCPPNKLDALPPTIESESSRSSRGGIPITDTLNTGRRCPPCSRPCSLSIKRP